MKAKVNSSKHVENIGVLWYDFYYRNKQSNYKLFKENFMNQLTIPKK
jgi:hypothetical protein